MSSSQSPIQISSDDFSDNTFDQSDQEIEQLRPRAPPPPPKIRLVSVQGWGSIRAILPGEEPTTLWSSWWEETPWRQKHLTKKFVFKGGRKTSDVWQYFQHIIRTTDGKPFIQCTRCSISLTHPTVANTGTSALKRHLKSGQCTHLAKTRGKGSITALLEAQHQDVDRSSIPSFSIRSFTEQTLRVIATLNLSFRALDSLEIKKWVQMIQKAPKHIPVSLLPSRKLIPALEITVADGQAEQLEKFPSNSKIAIAVDTWTSPNHLAFLALTGYFLDTNWKYHEILLGFEHIEGSHTGRRLASIIQGCLDNNSISIRRVISLTSDNAGNNKTLHRELSNALRLVNTDGQQGLCARLPCLSHVIQLACNELLTGIKINARNEAVIRVWRDDENEREEHSETISEGAPVTLKKIRNLAIYINASPQRREKFLQIQKRKRPLGLLQDVKTRWNSTLLMMIRARKLRTDIANFASENSDTNVPEFSQLDWNHINYLIEILYPFYVFTNAIGMIRHGPSIHQAFSVYNRLFNHIEDATTLLERKRKPWKRQIRQSLLAAKIKLQKYYADTWEIGDYYAIPMILAPHIKLTGFDGPEWEDENATEPWRDYYLRKLEEVYHQYRNALVPGQEDSRSSSTTSSSSEYFSSSEVIQPSSSPPRASSSTGSLKRKATSSLNSLLGAPKSKKTRVQNESEITKYLASQNFFGVDFDDGKDHHHILEFWKRAEPVYPTLAAIARDYLAIPAASVGIERLFSTARDICTYRRHRLKASSIRLLMMAIAIQRDKNHGEEEKDYDFDDTDDDAEDELVSSRGEDESDEDDQVEGLISDNEENEDPVSVQVPDELSLPAYPMNASGSARRRYLFDRRR